MESGSILDAQMSASSQYNGHNDASAGRLRQEKNGIPGGAWTPLTSDANQWLQIDLDSYYTTVTRAATQGRCCSYAQWATQYRLQYSNNGVDFQYYKELGQVTDKVKWVM